MKVRNQKEMETAFDKIWEHAMNIAVMLPEKNGKREWKMMLKKYEQMIDLMEDIRPLFIKEVRRNVS